MTREVVSATVSVSEKHAKEEKAHVGEGSRGGLAWVAARIREAIGPGLRFWVVACILLSISLVLSGLEGAYGAEVKAMSQPWQSLISEIFDVQTGLEIGAAAFAIAALLVPALGFAMSDTKDTVSRSLEAGLAKLGDRITDSLIGGDARRRIDVLSHLVDTSSLTQVQYQDVIGRLQRRRFKNLDEDDWEYFDFVSRKFIDLIYDNNPVFRQDFFSGVMLDEPTDEDLYADGKVIRDGGYLRWKRDINYYVRALRDNCQEEITTQTSNVIDPTMLALALKHVRFGIEIKVGDQGGKSLLNWEMGRAIKPEQAQSNAELLNRDGKILGTSEHAGYKIIYSMSYKIEETGDPVLDLRISVPWLLGRQRFWVRGWEHHLLRRDENFYHLNIRHPTKGIHAQMRLGQGLNSWSLLAPTLAPHKYPKESVPSVAESREGEDNEMRQRDYVDVKLPTWVLPGIALLKEWRYPMSDRIFSGTLRTPPTS